MKIDLPLDGTTRARARELSKAVFKSEYGLEILAAMAARDRFYAGEIVEMVPGLHQSYLSSFIQRLVSSGVLQADAKVDGNRRDYYRPAPSPLWAFVVEWIASLLDQPVVAVTQLRSS
jgi:hypothetical protein